MIVTTHVVRLKVVRLKAEGVQKARLMHFGGNRADSRTKHGFKRSRIPVFPNPAFGGTFSLNDLSSYSYSYMSGGFPSSNFKLFRNSPLPTKPTSLRLFSSRPFLFIKTAVGIPLIRYFLNASS